MLKLLQVLSLCSIGIFNSLAGALQHCYTHKQLFYTLHPKLLLNSRMQRCFALKKLSQVLSISTFYIFCGLARTLQHCFSTYTTLSYTALIVTSQSRLAVLLCIKHTIETTIDIQFLHFACILQHCSRSHATLLSLCCTPIVEAFSMLLHSFA